MIWKIKNSFLTFLKSKKKLLILTFPRAKRSLWFGALLFFFLFALILPIKAQAFDIFEGVFNAVLSVLIKVAGIVFFIIPLFISWVSVMIAGLILGWVISPDFINIPFTTNEFVVAGLSITRGFANMAFIIFLVVIALATALRIEEYKAKKTLTTLIMIALLINFSPVFCGLIIDATNVVMFTFLDNLTGIEGFFSTLERTTTAIWKLVAEGWGDPRASAWSFFMALAVIVFNFFAAFMFMVFSALFTVRYVMLWVLVILSPIAFVAYILPITRRGRTILSWKSWWEQFTQWSIIGIIAAFFLYLAFLMIGVMQKIQVLEPGPEGLGLANEILPFLVPIILLWIGWKECKKTSAMLARGIIDAPEKIGKVGAQAAIMIGAAVATGGATAAAGFAGKAGVAAKGLPGAVGQLGSRWKKYGKDHEGSIKGTVAGTIGSGIEKFGGWAKAQKESITEPITGLAERTKTGINDFKEEHKTLTKAGGWIETKAKSGLNAFLYGFTKEEKFTGRKLIEKEGEKDADGNQYRHEEKTKKIQYSEELTKMPGYKDMKDYKVLNDPITGDSRRATSQEEATRRVNWEKEEKSWEPTETKLTKEEIKSGHLINIGETRKPGGAIPTIKGALKQSLREITNQYLREVTSLSEDLRKEALELARKDLEEFGELREEATEKMRSAFAKFRTMENEGRKFGLDNLEKFEKDLKKKKIKKSDSESE